MLALALATFQAADPPQARVGQRSRVFLVLVVGLVLAGVGRAVADEGASVEPVVGADGHRHQGEGRKRSHGRQQHLDAAFTPHERRPRKEADVWEEERHTNRCVCVCVWWIVFMGFCIDSPPDVLLLIWLAANQKHCGKSQCKHGTVC